MQTDNLGLLGLGIVNNMAAAQLQFGEGGNLVKGSLIVIHQSTVPRSAIRLQMPQLGDSGQPGHYITSN